jgi:hypothetical protein
MKINGHEVKNPRILRRMVSSIHKTGKEELVQIIQDIYPGTTKKEARQAYDMVTSAINGWMIAFTKDLPKGMHAKLLLRDCFSVNLCWMKGKQDVYPDYPKIWVIANDTAARNFRRMRMREFALMHQKGQLRGALRHETIQANSNTRI